MRRKRAGSAVAALTFLLGAGTPRAVQAERKAARIQLPTDWRIGSEHHYRATWIGAWGKGAPAGVTDNEAKGEVTVTVAERSASGYLLRWKPTLVSDSGPGPAPGDMNALAVAFWRDVLALSVDLRFDAKTGALTVANGAAVRDRLSGQVREIVRAAGLDCEKAEAPGVCAQYSTEAAASAFALRHVAPFFACSGLDLESGSPQSWSEPAPDPQLAPVSMRYRREVLEVGSSQVRVRTVAEPDEEEMSAFTRREATRMGGPEPLQKAIEEMRLRVVTDCTMDRRSGWPLRIERTTRMGSSLFDGAETLRFERLPPKSRE